MYAIFATIDDFEHWHTQVCATLGIPNDAGTAAYTVALTSAVDSRVVAFVDDTVPHDDLALIDRRSAEVGGWARAVDLDEVPVPMPSGDVYVWDATRNQWQPHI